MGKQEQKVTEPYQIRISDKALLNIDDITAYIAYTNHQPLNAFKVSNQIFEIIGRIQKNPYGYKECEFIRTKTKMYRQALCYKWLIIYKILTNNEIIILGIVHGSKKPSSIKALRKVI